MTLSLIYARSENHCIGGDGKLPWQLPDEFAHFLATTQHSAIIMGRRSYEDHAYELPQRFNIVVTSQADYPLPPGVARAASLEEALSLAEARCEQVFVIGGADLLAAALPQASTVYETIVNVDCEGDTFIDPFDFSNWETQVLMQHPVDAQHALGFTAYRHSRPQ